MPAATARSGFPVGALGLEVTEQFVDRLIDEIFRDGLSQSGTRLRREGFQQWIAESRASGEIPRRIGPLQQEIVDGLTEITRLPPFFLFLHGQAFVNRHAGSRDRRARSTRLMIRTLESSRHVGVAIRVALTAGWKVEGLNLSEPGCRLTRRLLMLEDSEVPSIGGDDEVFAHND